MGGGLRGPVVIGGSQPGLMRVLDLGLIDIPSLVASGPVTLYTPTLGDLVDLRVVNPGDFVAPDGDLVARYGLLVPPVQLDGPPDSLTGDVSIGSLNPGATLDGPFSQAGPNVTAFGGPAGAIYQIGLRAGSAVIGGTAMLPAVGIWQANHAYSLHDSVLDGAGVVQVVSTAGTSGASVPAFDETPGNTTAEGPDTLVWTSGGVAPTVGAIHFYLCVATPIAP